jgi:hypothetical protein
VLVRELPDQVPGDRAAELPAGRLRLAHHERVRLLAADVGPLGEEPVARVEHDRQVVPQPELDRVVAEHVGPAEAGRPLLEDRPEVARRAR